MSLALYFRGSDYKRTFIHLIDRQGRQGIMPIFSAIMVFTEYIFFNRCRVINAFRRKD